MAYGILVCISSPSLLFPTSSSRLDLRLVSSPSLSSCLCSILVRLLDGACLHCYLAVPQISPFTLLPPMVAMSASMNLCCAHPQQRIDSPEPPPRIMAPIDGIFAAAALPQDHPHAMAFAHRAADPNPNIIKSPTLGFKIKSQFRKRSTKTLSRELEQISNDAHPITSKEVLHQVNIVTDVDAPPHVELDRPRIGVDVQERNCTPDDAAKTEVRASVLKSCEYLRPLLQKCV